MNNKSLLNESNTSHAFLSPPLSRSLPPSQHVIMDLAANIRYYWRRVRMALGHENLPELNQSERFLGAQELYNHLSISFMFILNMLFIILEPLFRMLLCMMCTR